MAELLHHAMDLKEAASLRDGAFAAHLAAPDKDALLDVETAVDSAFEEPQPQHERLEKLISVKHSLGKHVEAAPEDAVWRAELNEAVQAMEKEQA